MHLPANCLLHSAFFLALLSRTQQIIQIMATTTTTPNAINTSRGMLSSVGLSWPVFRVEGLKVSRKWLSPMYDAWIKEIAEYPGPV